MTRVLRSLAILLWLASTGCGSAIRSQVSSFHNLPQEPRGLTYAVLPFKEQEASLEFKSYEQRVRAHLEQHGFVPASLEQASLVVVFDYAIDGGHEVLSSYPIFGQTGTRSSTTTGTVQSFGNLATYSATTKADATYGVVGTGVSSDTEYGRIFRLEIIKRDAFSDSKIEKVYEAKVVSSGGASQLAAVVPAMIESLFRNFPGRSGEFRVVDMKVVPSVEEISNPPAKKQKSKSDNRESDIMFGR